MYFCQNCDSILDITKKINNPYVKEYSNVVNFLDDIDNNDTSGILKFNFKFNDILSNTEFKKKEKKNQEIILKQFKEKSNKLNVSFFVCKNCNFHDVLPSECVIFKSNLNEDIKEDLFLQNDRYLDNTIPRTKDFICPNKSCDSNKKSNELKKEAIFYRPIQDQYYLSYQCLTCNTVWNPRNN